MATWRISTTQKKCVEEHTIELPLIFRLPSG